VVGVRVLIVMIGGGDVSVTRRAAQWAGDAVP